MLLLFFIMLTIFIIFIFLCSEIRLSISNFQFSSGDKESTYDYKGKVEVYFLEKLKLFSMQLNRNKTRRILNKKFFRKKIEKNKELPKKRRKLQNKIIKNIVKRMQIRKLDFQLYVDTESVILTSYIVGIISTVIPNMIRNNIKKFNEKNYRFGIFPLYKSQNYIYVKLNCILSIKVVHIINIILKQRGIKSR